MYVFKLSTNLTVNQRQFRMMQCFVESSIPQSSKLELEKRALSTDMKIKGVRLEAYRHMNIVTVTDKNSIQCSRNWREIKNATTAPQCCLVSR